MRILLDECVPRSLRRELPGHDVRTVSEVGWTGKSNGELLQLMAGKFDVFVTVDQGLHYQQNLTGATVAVVVLGASTNRLADLLPLMPAVRSSLPQLRPGDVRQFSA